jgi:hypothetical protein
VNVSWPFPCIGGIDLPVRTAAPLALATLAGALFPSAASAATPVAASTGSDLVPALVIAGAGALVIMLIMLVVPGSRRRSGSTSEGDEAPAVTVFRARPVDTPADPEAEAGHSTPPAEPPEPARATADQGAATPEPAPAPAIPEPVAAAPESETDPAVPGPGPVHRDPEPAEGLDSVLAGPRAAHAVAEMTGATTEMTLLVAEAIAPEGATAHHPEPIATEASGEEVEMLDDDELPTDSEQIFRTVPPPACADEASGVAAFAGEHGAAAVADPPRSATAADPRPGPPPTAAPAPDLLSALSPVAVLGDQFDPERLRAATAQEPMAAPGPGLGLGRGPGPERDPRTVWRDHSLAVPLAAGMLFGVAVLLVRARSRR